MHYPLNSQKSLDKMTKIRIQVPRQVSIPIGREKQEKMTNLRVDGMTRKGLMYSSATSWRNRQPVNVLDMPKNSSQPISPLGSSTPETQKTIELNSKSAQKLLNGHTKNHNSHSKRILPTKRKSKTSGSATFHFKNFDTAMDFDSDLKIGSQNFMHNLEQNDQPITSVSQMS